jgi:hypothetical protein
MVGQRDCPLPNFGAERGSQSGCVRGASILRIPGNSTAVPGELLQRRQLMKACAAPLLSCTSCHWAFRHHVACAVANALVRASEAALRKPSTCPLLPLRHDGGNAHIDIDDRSHASSEHRTNNRPSRLGSYIRLLFHPRTTNRLPIILPQSQERCRYPRQRPKSAPLAHAAEAALPRRAHAGPELCRLPHD